MSEQLAPRPARSNWGRLIYNVLQDNGNKSMNKGQLWSAIPSQFHVPHAYGQFSKALANMTNHGYAIGDSHRGAYRQYKIAPLAHYEKRKKRDRGYQKKYTKPKSNGAVVDPILKSIDARITDVEAEIAIKKNKLSALKDMRKIAAQLTRG